MNNQKLILVKEYMTGTCQLTMICKSACLKSPNEIFCPNHAKFYSPIRLEGGQFWYWLATSTMPKGISNFRKKLNQTFLLLSHGLASIL
jgi:hypothetical protein